MRKHTPGPWHVSEQYGGCCVFERSEVSAIAEVANPKVCDVDNVDDVSRANARLIAAAPELLYALIAARTFLYQLGVTENHSFYGRRFIQIETAIEKAEGKQ